MFRVSLGCRLNCNGLDMSQTRTQDHGTSSGEDTNETWQCPRGRDRRGCKCATRGWASKWYPNQAQEAPQDLPMRTRYSDADRQPVLGGAKRDTSRIQQYQHRKAASVGGQDSTPPSSLPPCIEGLQSVVPEVHFQEVREGLRGPVRGPDLKVIVDRARCLLASPTTTIDLLSLPKVVLRQERGGKQNSKRLAMAVRAMA